MIHHLRNVLSAGEIAHLRSIVARAEFVDGRITNASHPLKQNQQISQSDPNNAEPSALLRDALFRHPDMRINAFPRTMAAPTISRYEPGMRYGWHMDEALFPSPPSCSSRAPRNTTAAS